MQKRTGTVRPMLTIALATMVAVGAIGIAHAHKGATGIVKTRMDDMKALGEHMKVLSFMVNGRRKYDAATAKDAAAKMAQHARPMPDQFPEGSTEHPSEALPAIWQDWPRFEKLANDLVTYAEEFVAAAPQTAVVAKPLVDRIGGTCSDCHKPFRKEQK